MSEQLVLIGQSDFEYVAHEDFPTACNRYFRVQLWKHKTRPRFSVLVSLMHGNEFEGGETDPLKYTRDTEYEAWDEAMMRLTVWRKEYES